MNNFQLTALVVGYATLILLVTLAVVFMADRLVAQLNRVWRKETPPPTDRDRLHEFKARMRKIVGSDDPNEIRAMLDQVWYNRIPPPIVPGPDQK